MAEFTLTKTPYGQFLLCDWEVVDQVVASGSFWDSFLQPYFDKCAGPEAVAIDVGANQGFHSVYLSPRYKKVYSFEMQKWVYWLLCANLALNYCYNVDAINMAAFDKDGNVSLATNDQLQFGFHRLPNGEIDYPAEAHFSSPGVQDLPGNMSACRIDSVVPLDDPVTLIKVDVQGADLRVLKGCEKILTRWHPAILFEYEGVSASLHGASLEDYYAFLTPFGYSFQTLEGGQATNVACEVPSEA